MEAAIFAAYMEATCGKIATTIQEDPITVPTDKVVVDVDKVTGLKAVESVVAVAAMVVAAEVATHATVAETTKIPTNINHNTHHPRLCTNENDDENRSPSTYVVEY